MITKLFIKQCEKAEEIQKMWIPRHGDWIYSKNMKRVSIINNKYPPVVYYRNQSIHLLTQEQLQKIILPILKKKFEGSWDMKRINIWMIQHFINFMHDIDYFESLNEFWLAFVMKEKYKKIWNRKDWVKE